MNESEWSMQVESIVQPIDSKEEMDSRVAELLKVGMEEEVSFNRESALESIFDAYRMIDFIQSHEVDKFQGLRDFLLNLKKILKSFEHGENQDVEVEQFQKVLDDTEVVIHRLISEDASLELIKSELEAILMKVEDLIRNVPDKDSFHNKTPIVVRSYVELLELDKLYESLYAALSENNLKKAILYRGRIIRELKRREKTIGHYYNEVKGLEKIRELLRVNRPFEEVKAVLSNYKDFEYYEILMNVSDFRGFRSEFERLYEKYQVHKILLYNDALNQEIKDQNEDLKKRFSNEFLENKESVGSLVFVLPNGVGLDIKKLANRIDDDRKESTDREKAAKAIEIARATGKVADTSIYFLGKFIASNWYTLYALRKGVVDTGRKKDIEVQIKKEETAKVEDETSKETNYEEEYQNQEENAQKETTPEQGDELEVEANSSNDSSQESMKFSSTETMIYDYNRLSDSFRSLLGEGNTQEFEDPYGGKYILTKYEDGSEFIIKPYEKSICLADGSVYSETDTNEGIERILTYQTDVGPVTQVIDENGTVLETLESNENYQLVLNPNEWVLYTKSILPGPSISMFIPKWLAKYYDSVIDSDDFCKSM